MNYNLFGYLDDMGAYIALGFFTACLAGSVSYGIWVLLDKRAPRYNIKRELLCIKAILCCYIVPFLLSVFRMVTIKETDPRITYFTTPLTFGFVILTMIWLVFVLYHYAYMLIMSARFRNMWEKSDISTDKELLAIVDKWKQELGVRNKITLHCNCDVSSPGMIYREGYHILLPRYEISLEEMNMVLLHEIMHMKRKDILLKETASMIRLCYSFLPFLGRLSQKIVDWTEAACDMACCEAGEKEFTQKDYFTCIVNLKLRSQAFVNSDMMYCFFEEYTTLDFRVDTLKRWREKKPKLRVRDKICIGVFAVVLSAVCGVIVSSGINVVRDRTIHAVEAEPQVMPELKESDCQTIFADSDVQYRQEDIMNQENSTDFSLKPGEVRVYNIRDYDGASVSLNLHLCGGDYQAGYICEDSRVLYVENGKYDMVPAISEDEQVYQIFIKNTDDKSYDVELFLNEIAGQ